MNSLKPPFGLDFGANKEKVKDVIENVRKGSEFISQSTREIVSFYDLFFANRNINYAYFYFIDDKLCKVKLIINDYSNLKKMIEDYNRIKSEIN